MEENLGAADIELTPDDLREIESAASQITVHGDRYPPLPDHSFYERLHDEVGCDAWLVGRVTGQEFASRDTPYPPATDTSLGRQSWFARKNADAWAVVLDAGGKIAWGRGDVGGDPLLVVLTQVVLDSHLTGLQQDGVSYIFAGEREIDLVAALEALNRELGIRRPKGTPAMRHCSPTYLREEYIRCVGKS